jgi:branched-chain amino acid transport system permease protein
MTSTFLIPAFTAAVLGGMTSLPGAFVGGVLIGILESVATSAPIFEDIPGTKSTLVVFVVLLLVLVIRPQGLFGTRA